MFNWIKSFYALPSAAEVAKADLETYERALLKAQADADYQARMVEYYKAGIKRLAGFKTHAHG